MKKLLFIIFGLITLFSFNIKNSFATDLQSQVLQQIESGASGAEFSNPIDFRIVLVTIVKFLLTFVGSIFLVLIILSSYWLITAQGDEGKVEKAMNTIKRAVIGLIIALMAYGITVFVTIGVQRVYGTYRQPQQEPAQGVFGNWWDDLTGVSRSEVP